MDVENEVPYDATLEGIAKDYELNHCEEKSRMMWSRRWPRFINVWDIPQEMLSSGCSRFLEPEGDG